MLLQTSVSLLKTTHRILHNNLEHPAMTTRYWCTIQFTPMHAYVGDRSLLKWIAYKLDHMEIGIAEGPSTGQPYCLSLPVDIAGNGLRYYHDVLVRYLANKLRVAVDDWLADNFSGKPLPFDRAQIFGSTIINVST
ncbi:hypothetical protein N7468_001695 [Penicillium chermesinum]|uniref:Uncharacterized protein n=1 Tax=Penicillium chermesinum TaxID=63820 RepID=A0A9W9TXB6_9EURO|nr:uncharacterized protein N7468_001695 [Penicillium chermesinum]KAJ5246712.1 hypothetical protein N7468_001695 [Penicillium chermesinum]